MSSSVSYGPAVSVIVPVYNAQATIRRCVDSILAQTYGDFELLLVDDGSSDGSAAICKEYSETDPRVKYLRKENGGVSSARNMGLDHASGRYVVFCDSDDSVREGWISSMMAVCEDAQLVVSGYRMLDPRTSEWEDRSLPETEVFQDKGLLLETLFRFRLIQFIWNKLFSLEIINRAGLRFNEDFTIFEDEYFVLGYLAHTEKVISVPQCGYEYRLPDNFMKKYDFGIEAYGAVVRKIFELIPGRRLPLPGVVYWYKTALGRYASAHSYGQTRDHIKFGRKMAAAFHDGPLNHVILRFFPSSVVYALLRLRSE